MNLVVKKKKRQSKVSLHHSPFKKEKKKKRASLHLRKPRKKKTNSLRIKCDGAEGEEKEKTCMVKQSSA